MFGWCRGGPSVLILFFKTCAFVSLLPLLAVCVRACVCLLSWFPFSAARKGASVPQFSLLCCVLSSLSSSARNRAHVPVILSVNVTITVIINHQPADLKYFLWHGRSFSSAVPNLCGTGDLCPDETRVPDGPRRRRGGDAALGTHAKLRRSPTCRPPPAVRPGC